jgi:isopenicillin N synthase-like dioxygenase
MSQPGPADAVPVVDLTPWWDGDERDRAAVASAVDAGLRVCGSLQVTGHRVVPALREAVCAASGEFFALPAGVKRLRAAGADGRGWLPAGAGPGAFESLGYGADTPSGDPALDARWFRPNPWPAEVPGLAGLLRQYIWAMRDLADDLLDLCAVALDLPEDQFRPYLTNPGYTLDVNVWPRASPAGAALTDRPRVGPPTDLGTLTLLDRPAGDGGLAVGAREREWLVVPGVAGAPGRVDALTVQVGDRLARWTGDRWPAAGHRLLPPPDGAGELVWLVFRYHADPARVAPGAAG